MNTTATDSPLRFTSLQAGTDYLSQLSLANPLVAERQLMSFLDALLDSPPDPGILLALLEHTRAPLCFVEDEMARRYSNKPLPFGNDEESCFQQVLLAWQKMSKAYALCAHLEQPDTGSTKYLSLVASILHRCIYYTGMVVFEHYRARREPPPGIWLDLHGYYETAESWGVAFTPVEDSLENNLQATHCAAAYVALLLVDIACPYSKSLRNILLIRRWAVMWAPLVSIHKLDDDFEVPAFSVELMKDTPLHPTPVASDPGKDVRQLDTSRLNLQINHMLSQLRQRMQPSQLGLGEETSAHVISLLEEISRPWSQLVSPRRFRRFVSKGISRVALGFEAMHYYVSQREFMQPDTAAAFSRDEFDALYTFRDRAEPKQALVIRPHTSYPVDEWSVINHSANGFRLARNAAGQKLFHGQLMALCPHDGDQFFLALVSWLMQEDSGGLLAGVATLPGVPQGIGIRIATRSAGNIERYVRAFMLPAVPAIREDGSLVLPPGMYHAGRILELFIDDDTICRVCINHMIQRGADFERVSYQLL